MTEQIQECEVKQWRTGPEGRMWGWQLLSALDAKKVGTPLTRCKDCHGPVKLMGSTRAGATSARAIHINKEDAEYCVAGLFFIQAKDGRKPQLSKHPIE